MSDLFYKIIDKDKKCVFTVRFPDNKQSITLAYFIGHLSRTVLDCMCHHVTNCARCCLSFKLILASLLASSGNFNFKW
jgi:hypothetical protein